MYYGNINGEMPLAIDSMFIAINKKLFMHGNNQSIKIVCFNKYKVALSSKLKKIVFFI